MSFTVTATEGGNTANGIALTLKVLTGASSSQPGAVAQTHGSGGNATQALTPTYTGSVIYGAILAGPTTLTANASTTFDQQYTAVSLRFIQFHSSSTTTATTPVTLGATSGVTTGIGIAVCEIQASGTIAEAASVTASTSSVHAVTSPSVTPAGGTLLVLMVSSNGNAGSTSMTVTDTSGLGLTWTQQEAANGSSDGYSGVWTAPVPGGGGSGGALLLTGFPA